MQSLSNIYGIGVGNCPDSYNNFVNGMLINSDMFNIENSSGGSRISYADAKALASNRSHSEAERKRRRRINAHLATLRTLLPNTIKTDKASLLAEVVRCLRELKEKTEESDISDDTTMNSCILPTETDDLKLCYCHDEGQGQSSIIQATICCEDRPTMMVDLTKALNSVEAKIVRAEMATIGGRIKNVLWVQIGVGGDEGLVKVKRALKLVLDNSTFLPALGQGLPGNKRPRRYHS